MVKRVTTRRYSDAEKAAIVAYYKQHGITRLLHHYPRLGSGTVYHWLEAPYTKNKTADARRDEIRARQQRDMRQVRQSKPNGRDHHPALIYLEKWRKARLEHIRAGHDTNGYDVYAELALMELQKQ